MTLGLVIGLAGALGMAASAALLSAARRFNQRRSRLERWLDPSAPQLDYAVRTDFVDLAVLRSVAANAGVSVPPDRVEIESFIETADELRSELGGHGFKGGFGRKTSKSTRSSSEVTLNVDDFVGVVIAAMLQSRSFGVHLPPESEVESSSHDAIAELRAQGAAAETLEVLEGQVSAARSRAVTAKFVSDLEAAADGGADVLLEGKWEVEREEGSVRLVLRQSSVEFDKLVLEVVVSAEANSGAGLTTWGAARLMQGKAADARAAVIGAITTSGRDNDGTLRIAVTPIAVYTRVALPPGSASRAQLARALQASRSGAGSIWLRIAGGVGAGTLAVALVTAAISGAFDTGATSTGCPPIGRGPLMRTLANPIISDSASDPDSFGGSYVDGTCRMRFLGYCFGAPYDSPGPGNGTVPDVRWLVRADGRVVPASPGRSAQVLAMKPLRCRGGVPAPDRIVAQGELYSGQLAAHLQASVTTAGFVGFVRAVPGHAWQRIGQIDESDPSAANGGVDVKLAGPMTTATKVRAVACVGYGVPSARTGDVTLTLSRDTVGYSADSVLEPPLQNAERAACTPRSTHAG